MLSATFWGFFLISFLLLLCNKQFTCEAQNVYVYIYTHTHTHTHRLMALKPMHSYVTFVALNKYVGKMCCWEDVHLVGFTIALVKSVELHPPVLAERLPQGSLYNFKRSHVQTRAKFCSV